MEKLKKAGLFGGALVPLSGSLAKRYNDCLAMLGVSPTKLSNFSIDAMGWSPEIAAEKQEKYYLNTGEANANAIIISPEQHGKPVHMPTHSFDRDLMHAVFVAYEKPIRDITKDAALCVHLDQHIDAFYAPFDLLRYDTISVSFNLLNDLERKQQEQLELVKLFKTGNNFIDREVHKKVLDSARQYGDLRTRKLNLEPLTLKVSSFHTRAFGGVFILKDFIKDIMIFEDEAVFKKAIKDTDHEVMLFHTGHDELMNTLVDHLIAEHDLSRSIKTPRYERIKKHVFSQSLEQTEHPVNEILENQFLFKKYLNELDIETRKEIMGVELYLERLSVSNETKREELVTKDYFKVLHRPHSSLEQEHKKLIWQLLINIAPLDPVHLYWYDKAAFYEAYNTWDTTYRDWVIASILENNENSEL